MAVRYVGLGYVTVTTAGTPAQVSAQHIVTPGCLIEAAPTNSGNIYVGDSTLDATHRGCELTPGSSIEIVGPNIGGSEEEIDLFDLWVDSSANGDKVIVSYFKRS
jgi:hypothetical protein